MGARWSRGALIVLTAFVLSACTITTKVQPIPRDVAAVCIKENPKTWSKGFLPALRAQFESHGVHTSVYTGDAPAECRYRVEYDANWSWDFAVYLEYADVRVYDNDRMIGRATYDARDGGGRLDKLGSTEGKLERIMTQLLAGPPSAEEM